MAKKRDRSPHLGRHIYRRKAKRSSTGYVYYGDFRRYADVGGKQEALCPVRSTRPTSDPDIARRLYGERVKHYEEKRRGLHSSGDVENPRLGEAITWHLTEKAKNRAATSSTIERDEQALRNVYGFFGNCRLGEITTPRLGEYIEHRKKQPGVVAGSVISPGTIRNELHSLSNLFERAIAEEKAATNPVKKMVDKPTRPREEALFLERAEAALLLDAAAAEDEDARAARRAADLRRLAQRYGDARSDERARTLLAQARRAEGAALRHPNVGRNYAYLEAVITTFLYTGGRSDEVLGLLVEDIDFEAKQVRFRPNRYRRLKRDHCNRAVELWPALEVTLRSYLAHTGRTTGLLFPSTKGGKMHNFNKQFARCCQRADEIAKERGMLKVRSLVETGFTPHSLRHTYATMLLHTTVPTLNGGRAMCSAHVVGHMLGHRSSRLVEDTYGHLLSERLVMDELSYEPLRQLPAARLAPPEEQNAPPDTQAAPSSPPAKTKRPAAETAGRSVTDSVTGSPQRATVRNR